MTNRKLTKIGNRMKDKRNFAINEIDKLYKKAKISHDEVEAMRLRQIKDINNCPLIRHKIIFLERLLGVNKSQYDCLIEIINNNCEWLHSETELVLKQKQEIIEDWANLRS